MTQSTRQSLEQSLVTQASTVQQLNVKEVNKRFIQRQSLRRESGCIPKCVSSHAKTQWTSNKDMTKQRMKTKSFECIQMDYV